MPGTACNCTAGLAKERLDRAAFGEAFQPYAILLRPWQSAECGSEMRKSWSSRDCALHDTSVAVRPVEMSEAMQKWKLAEPIAKNSKSAVPLSKWERA